MAVTATPALPQNPVSGKVQILPADTSSLKTVATGGTNGTKIVALIASSTDTTARDVQWGITRSAVFYPIATKTVPITSGFVAGTPSVALLNVTDAPGLPLDADGQPYLFLQSGDTLQAKSLTTVTTAKEIDLQAMGADF